MSDLTVTHDGAHDELNKTRSKWQRTSLCGRRPRSKTCPNK